MKYTIFTLICIVFVFQLRTILGLGKKDFKIWSNLPAGVFRFNLKSWINNCSPLQYNKIQFHLYLTRNTNNITEMKGNFSNTVPIDDTMFLDINAASRYSSGEWKNNVYMHKLSMACSSFKNVVGNGWYTLSRSLGFPDNCPIPVGVYNITEGLDLVSLYQKSNLPRTFVYGTYKVRINYLRNNEVCGCFSFIVEVIRP